MAFLSSVCKILKCDGELGKLIGKKQANQSSSQVAYGNAADALGVQTKEAALFGESVKVWDSGEEAAAVAYGAFLDASAATLATTNPSGTWISDFTKAVNDFTETYLTPLL